MSPKTPIRPGTSSTGRADTSTIRAPDSNPAIPSRRPGTAHPVLPGVAANLPSTTSAAAVRVQLPDPVPVTISSIASAVANRLPSGRPLSAYARPAPKGLPPPDSDGFRVAQQRRFVNLDDGQIVMVRYDESAAAYRVQAREEHLPSGPALYRVEGSDIWRESGIAGALRQYQLPARSSATEGGHPEQITSHHPLLQYRSRLLNDAESYFKDHKMPDRPPVPKLHPEANERVLIETLYRHSEGLIIGENHAASGARLFLVTNMATLAEHGVRTLYVERLRTDVEQVHLDTLHNTGILSSSLDSYLRILDGDYAHAAPGACSYYNLISTARAQGIRVQALDCAASYSHGVPHDGMFNRATALSYHAHRLIEADRSSGRQGRWLALVNIHHATGYAPKTTPGLNRLQGVVGLEAEDVMSGPAMRAIPVPPLNADDPMRLVRSDLKLSVKVPWREALEIPLQYRNALQVRIRSPEEIVRRTHFGIDERATDEMIIDDFLRREERLNGTSERFFRRHYASRHANPRALQSPADSSESRVLESLYEGHDGLVLGTEPGSITARKLLLDNMQTLATLKVEKLYVQNLLTDLDQPFIDDFYATGIMPKAFETTLAAEDSRQALGLTNEYSLQRLLISAREHGIKVQALDMAASYRKQQQKHNVPTFNYIAHTIIDNDQQHHGAHKWLALVLDVHAGNVRGVPGIAQLQGVSSLRTVAIGPQTSPKLDRDPGYVGRFYDRNEYVRTDLVLEVNTDSAPGQRVAQDPRSCLDWREVESSFLVERQGDKFILVQKSYRLDEEHYVETPIEVHDGKYSLPQGVTLLNGVQYHSLADLVWGLKGAGYVQAAEIPGVIPIPTTPRLDTHPQLNRPGMFLFDETANGPVLINRSRDRSLTVTPIRRNPAGKLYINHARWGYDETRLFDSQDNLNRDLIQYVSLTPYSASFDF
ncbi:membrane-targeted effector domain-containing toxin [Pseudomonas agarici]|uniref:membrane-targeted effector domain-containing toxin n=1 Tax=Pseudomonas agarici TaxID=46677 RepID=UPI000B19FE00|nr:membrane-targeted effector domain-containing toxin [Pseudomonas agarici]